MKISLFLFSLFEFWLYQSTVGRVTYKVAFSRSSVIMSTEMEKVPTTVTVDKEETTWEREKQSPMHPMNEAKNQGETKSKFL